MSARRSHYKSRTGCGNCKRRKIKCDEGKPECAKCLQHAILCDYSHGPQEAELAMRSSSIAAGSKSRSKSKVSVVVRQKSAPYPTPSSSAFSSTPVSRATSSDRSDASSPYSQNDTESVILYNPSAYGPMQVVDIRLFHHYTTTASSTLVLGRPGAGMVFESILPQLSFEYPFLLHTVLAISGLHIQVQNPTRDAGFGPGYGTAKNIELTTAKHIDIALREYRRELNLLADKNTTARYQADIGRLQALFLASSLIGVLGFESFSKLTLNPCTIYAAVDYSTNPSPQNNIVDCLIHANEDDPLPEKSGLESFAACLFLNQGIQMMLNLCWDAIKNSSISPLFRKPAEADSEVEYDHPLLNGIKTLFEMCQSEPPKHPTSPSSDLSIPPEESIDSEYSYLYETLSDLHKSALHSIYGNVCWMFIWLFRCPQVFTKRLVTGHWREMVVVAWYLALLSYHQKGMKIWWLGMGTAVEECRNICRKLERMKRGEWVKGLPDRLEEFEEEVREGDEIFGEYLVDGAPVLWDL